MADGEDQVTSPNGNPESGGNALPEGITSSAKRRRGRPPGSKNSDTPLDTGTTDEKRSNPRAALDAVESAKFIGVGFVSLIELAESFIHSSCANRIEKRIPGKLGEFKEMAKTLGLQTQDKETMQACVEKIASKYDWMTKHGPEFVLGVMIAQYGLRQAALMKFTQNVTATKPGATAPTAELIQPQPVKA